MVTSFRMAHSHEERIRKVHTVYCMVCCSHFDKDLCLYFEIQEMMVFGNCSHSNYYILAK